MFASITRCYIVLARVVFFYFEFQKLFALGFASTWPALHNSKIWIYGPRCYVPINVKPAGRGMEAGHRAGISSIALARG